MKEFDILAGSVDVKLLEDVNLNEAEFNGVELVEEGGILEARLSFMLPNSKDFTILLVQNG